MRFIKKNSGPQRGLGSFRMIYDPSINSQVGQTVCGNEGIPALPCPAVGYLRHLGWKFSPSRGNYPGVPVTPTPDMVGPVGGFGWLLNLFRGPPKIIQFEYIEVDPSTPLMLSIPYPKGTTFSITAIAEDCFPGQYSCSHGFTQASSISAVRNGNGDTYYVDTNGVLTLRIVQFPHDFVGNPWLRWNWNSTGSLGNGFALGEFSRDGVLLPHNLLGGNYLRLVATCAGAGNYCSNQIPSYDPDVCPYGYTQVAYDKCCRSNNPLSCVFADGSHP